MKTFDVIVIGTGGVGGAAAFQLARRGVRVAGLDRFPNAHDRGSSHGQTRMIRQAYCEHPDYVPLVQRSFELWTELEQMAGRRLYHEVGLLQVGPPAGVVIPGVLQSVKQHALNVEQLDATTAAERFPGFNVPEQATALFEQRAGYLLVEECVTAHQAGAVQFGAELKTVEVRNWSAGPGGVIVQTDRESLAADRLVIAAGAWSGALLGQLGVSLTVLRRPQNWFATTDPSYTIGAGCPGFLFETPGGTFYGFPKLDERGVKVGEHSGGSVIVDPSRLDREVDLQQRARVEQFLKHYLPGVGGPVVDHSVCMYTMSPDEHFIVDRHPAHENVVFAAGLSGHGFKFAPVLGEALADLSLEGTTELPIDFLRCDRFR